MRQRLEIETSRRDTAFTILELLVVMTIITVLLATLVPVTGKAMEFAESVRCRSNLHGVSNAMAQWLQDHQNAYPLFAVPRWGALMGKLGDNAYEQGNVHDSDVKVLNPYLGFTGKGAEVKIAHCPSDKGDSLANINYPMYRAMGNSYLSLHTNYGGIARVTTWPGGQVVRATNIDPLIAAEPLHLKILVGDWSPQFTNRPMTDARNQWHEGASERWLNILFADSHVELFLLEGTLNNTTPNPINGFW